MKKITLLTLTTVLSVVISFAQTPIFFEDFDGATSLPPGWETYDEAGLTPEPGTGFTNGEWIPRNDAVASVSWFEPAGQADSWLVTPLISINSDNLVLSWLARSVDPDFPEAYEVLISTTGNEVSDFTDAPVYTNPAESGTATTRSVSLAAYDGQDIYIAFRLVSDDAFILSIDDVRVGEPEPFSQKIEQVTPNVGVYHNAGTGGGDFSALYPAALDVLVVDYSDRTNFSLDVTISNDGTESIDTLYLGFFMVELNTNQFIEFVDTIVLASPLASEETYTHTFSSNITVDISNYPASNGAIVAVVFIPESSINASEDEFDFLLFSAVEPFTAGFSSSFDAVQGQNLSFLNDTYTWKQFNNAGAQSWVFRTFSDIQPFDGTGILLAGPGATNDIIQSPEFSFESGKTYQASVWARSGFGFTASSAARLVNGTNTDVQNLGGISLTAADTLEYTKFAFNFTVPVDQDDYMIEFVKTTGGLIVLDLFEVIEVIPPTVNLTSLSGLSPGSGVEYCDSTVTLNYTTSGPADELVIDWGDGNTSTVDFPNTSGNISYQYSSLGNFDITAEVENAEGTASSNTLSVEIAATPVANADFVIASQSNGVVTLINNSTPNCPGVTYIWDFGDNTVEQGNVTSHTYTANGTYTIQLTVNNGQGSVNQFSREVTITGAGPNSINDLAFDNSFNVFPSPTNNVVNVAFNLTKTQNIEVAIQSVDGRVINVQNFSNNSDVSTSFNVSSLSSGLYFVKITTEEGFATRKFVVSHN